jgi:hypothetical protein
MAALLLSWADFQVDYACSQWLSAAPGFEGNIATKTGRLAWLERHPKAVAFLDLDTWLTAPLPVVLKESRWIVISSAQVDAVGEGAATVAWQAFDGLLDRLDQAMRRLLALGFTGV